MENHERQLVLDQLASSEARLLVLVEGLTPEQWNCRQTSETGRSITISSSKCPLYTERSSAPLPMKSSPNSGYRLFKLTVCTLNNQFLLRSRQGLPLRFY